jgi:hypothetical protein
MQKIPIIGAARTFGRMAVCKEDTGKIRVAKVEIRVVAG